MVTIDKKKISPTKKIIDNIKIQIIYIPLKSKLGYTFKPLVQVGDYVSIGTPLGKSDVCDLLLTSSVSGTVVGLTKKYISDASLVNCLVIENDFKEKYYDKIGKKKDITKYSKDEFIYLLKKCGITGMSGNDFPTYLKYDTKKELNYLIINGAECDAYTSADSAIMYNFPEEILECIDAIMEIMHISKAYIAINESNTLVIDKLLRYINTYPNIKIYSLLDAYPNGYERYLVKEIFSQEYHNNPEEVGIITENVSTIYAIYEALKYHKPLSERIITIAGPGIKKEANYKVKIGTNFSEIILKTEDYNKLKDPILISGGLMMGTSIASDELIVTKDLSCIIVTNNLEEISKKCIKCGKCTEVCPSKLIPSMIIEHPASAKKLKIDRCIECGLCSYICPSKIEIRDKIRKIKEGSKWKLFINHKSVS